MKTYLHLLSLTALAALFSFTGRAQDLKYPYRLFDLPPFAPDTYFSKPISSLGLRKSNYSVLIKVRLPGDSVYYTIPGVLPTGDSFGFRIKVGNRQQSDTLYLIRRGGIRPVQLYEVCVYVFSRREILLYSRSGSEFTKNILMSYYHHTQQGNEQAHNRSLGGNRIRLPYVSVFSNLYTSLE